MNLHAEIREAQAIAQGLRGAAAVCLPTQNVLKTRLTIAAERLDQLATLAGRAVERIEALQLELAGVTAARDEAIRQLGCTREFDAANWQDGAIAGRDEAIRQPLRRCADCRLDLGTGPGDTLHAAFACPLFGKPRSGIESACPAFIAKDGAS